MGFWGKGNNPFFNHDFDAAQRDREAHRASETAHKEKLAHELDLQNQRSDSDAALSRLRIKKNAMEAQYNEKIKAHEVQIEEMRKAFYFLLRHSCIYQNTLNELMVKHPDMKDEILDEIQSARDFNNRSEVKNNELWKLVHEVNINREMDVLKFPYEEREPKK
ncbi:hypothetical protein [Leclercia adecarboxylata]|uniref:hypothetical protein n=1 Tax=Leclercia adecarboxylata TaxID=83655 RepID=UPI0021F1BC41|nr:hypothetical protein [Leclercia adecarboxylata]UYM56348.1 hypothetical protein N5937_03305 [Leclercia adecarboxylata]